MSASLDDFGFLQTGRRAGLAMLPAVPPRQRTRLWELNSSVHCSIIGTCLTTSELRRVMAKVVQGEVSRFSDHDLHGQAVNLCVQRDGCAKLLNKALDRRHEVVIRQFARLRGEDVVLGRWREAQRAGEIPGAYWAVLTHPDTSHAGLRQVFGDVHMLSHLVGAANRADIRRLAALEEENAALREKVDRQQLRLQEAVTSRDATIRRLTTLAGCQANASATDAPLSDIGEEAQSLRLLVADLQARLAGETARRERLERRIADAADSARSWERRAAEAERQQTALRHELALLEQYQGSPEQPPAASKLLGRRILYVGGRPGSVAQLSALLADAGADMLCHDGGRHDHPSLLPGLVGRADLVVFPVDCVSHDAALAVKRLCRQIGRPWSPLRSSGIASFLAGLAAQSVGVAS